MDSWLINRPELVEALLEDIERPKRWFALLDGTRPDGALTTFFLHGPEADYYPLFAGTELAPCLPYSAYLVAVTAKEYPWVEQASDTRTGVIWFRSSQSMRQQIPYWQGRMRASLNDASEWLFRYWDGQVLNRLLPVLSLRERAQLLGPAELLVVPDPDTGCWRYYQLAEQPQVRAPEPASPWILQAHHLAAFQAQFQGLQTEDFEVALWEQYSDLAARWHPLQFRRRVENGLNQGRRLGLNQAHGLLQFLVAQLRWGMDFWQQPPLSEIWTTANPEQEFRRWLAVQGP